MLDYILSHDGQVGFGKGGLTPYRPDVQASEVPRATYDGVVKEVGGEDKVVPRRVRRRRDDQGAGVPGALEEDLRDVIAAPACRRGDAIAPR